jgi:hypothetical protein
MPQGYRKILGPLHAHNPHARQKAAHGRRDTRVGGLHGQWQDQVYLEHRNTDREADKNGCPKAGGAAVLAAVEAV